MSWREDVEIDDADIEEINAMFGGAKVPTCCHRIMANPCMKLALMIPLGGAFGAICCVVGTIYFASGLDSVDDMLDTAGVDLGNYFDLIQTFSNLFILPSVLVTLYGFREKFRVKWNRFAHCDNCCCWLIKCAIVKPLFLFIIVLFFILSLISLTLFEALWIAMWAIFEACKASSDAVEDIIDLTGSYAGDDITSRVDDVCDAIKDGKNGGQDVTTGLVIILIGQIIGIAYFMKYTTLGGLRSMKEADDDEEARDAAGKY